tara:strand:+ start:1672 stop:2190 length:519 start_codon:yes stop_codon:yes gene_type:complete
MKKLNLILNSIIFLFFSTQLYSQEHFISGKANIIDGDTIKIFEEKIRFYGIDAPEIKQKCKKNWVTYLCGVYSKNFLISLIADSDVTCEYTERDRYKRIIGICYLGNIDLIKIKKSKDKEINRLMVLNGHAVAYKQYSKKYIKDEKFAKSNFLGLWSHDTEFEMPWEWRKKK